MSITSVRLQADVENPLSQLAKKLDRSKNYLINQAIKEFVERKTVEEIRWQETIHAIDSIKSGHIVEELAVNTWLDSWGTDKELNPPKL